MDDRDVPVPVREERVDGHCFTIVRQSLFELALLFQQRSYVVEREKRRERR